MRTLRFSLRLNNDLPVADFTRLAEGAEEAGFDQIWVSHDLFLRAAPVLVASAAARTERIKLGIGVMNPYSIHPAEIAMSAATLQELSGGRFLLGLAAGAAEFLAWAGIARTEPLARTREAVLACRALLSGERPATLAGTGTWGREARLTPSFPVPIYLGAMGPRMLALAGTVADGVLALSFPPERAAAAAAVVREAARAAGREETELDLPACFWCSIDDDQASADDAMKDKLAYYGPSLSAVMLDDAGLAPEDFIPAARALAQGETAVARTLVTREMLGLAIAGNAADVVARCTGLVASGADHLSFGPPLGPDPLASLERLGRDVLPVLRGAGAETKP